MHPCGMTTAGGVDNRQTVTLSHVRADKSRERGGKACVRGGGGGVTRQGVGRFGSSRLLTILPILPAPAPRADRNHIPVAPPLCRVSNRCCRVHSPPVPPAAAF